MNIDLDAYVAIGIHFVSRGSDSSGAECDEIINTDGPLTGDACDESSCVHITGVAMITSRYLVNLTIPGGHGYNTVFGLAVVASFGGVWYG